MWWSVLLFLVFLAGAGAHAFWQIWITEKKIKRNDLSDSDVQVGGVK